MPPLKLSKVSIPPRPRPTPPAGTPSPVSGPGGDLPADPTVQDDPTILTDPGLDPAMADTTAVGGSIGETARGFAVARAVPAPVAGDEGTAHVPTALIERLWRAVDTVPGLTIDAALTLALSQFLASLPDDDTAWT